MSESKFWKNINGMLAAEWDANRVDNKLNPGFPDVSYGMRGKNGFIELKYLKKWPKHPHTAIDFGSSFRTQRHWITRRHAYGGLCFLFLWVETPSPEWLLMDGDGVANLPHKFTRGDLTKQSAYCWRDWIDQEALIRALSGDV